MQQPTNRQRFGRVLRAAWTAAAVVPLLAVSDGLLHSLVPSWLRSLMLIATFVTLGWLLRSLVQYRSAIARSRKRHEAIFETHPLPVLLANEITLRIVGVNTAACAKYGFSGKEFRAMTILDLYRPEDRESVGAAWRLAVQSPRAEVCLGTHLTHDGIPFTAELVSAVFELDGDRIWMMAVIDVSARDAAVAETRESNARYRQIFETAREGIVTLDAKMAIATINQKAAEMLGYSTDELVGRNVYELSEPRIVDRVEETWLGEHEMNLRDRDGAIVSIHFNRSRLVDSEGDHEGQLGIIANVAERRGFEDELAFQALHDGLTGLPNRLLFIDHLQIALGRSTRGAPGVTVVFVDVDDFKTINGTLGYAVGDQLLREIAARLANLVRERDTVARFGGNEFVVLCEADGRFAEKLAEDIRTAMNGPWSVSADEFINITVSIGVAVGQNGDRPGTLLRNADMAVLQAKASGGDRTVFFTDALQTSSRNRLAMVSDLRRALEREELSLRFQPVVSLSDGRILGAEALLRWEHPIRGSIPPGEFIPVAEEMGLIDSIGQWVIHQTCARLADWQKIMPELTISLNISVRQLSSGHLNQILSDAIGTTGANPAQLVLEITESVLADDVEIALLALNSLRETGAAISIDDFGTGYSSLSYLHRFPVDVLKIDQSFVAGLPDRGCDAALVQAIMAIAHALELSVIAEGVETAEQASTLLSFGCLQAQGYYFYLPLTAEEFEMQLTKTMSAFAL
jgi:diguanylate cyclase (GGDEF)-like protein/PAS domain S-box-containing protein